MAEEVEIECPSCRHRGKVASSLIGEHVDCPRCGQPFVARKRVRRVTAEPSEAAPVGQHGGFPALRIIAALYQALAVIALVGGIILLLVAHRADAGVVLAIAAGTLVAPLTLWGSGELILVFLQIERNTRR